MNSNYDTSVNAYQLEKESLISCVNFDKHTGKQKEDNERFQMESTHEEYATRLAKQLNNETDIS